MIIQSKRWVLMLAPLVVFYIPYLIVNHIHVVHQKIPLIPGEDQIPFIPWTIIVYLSVFLQGIIVFWKVQKYVFPNIFKLMGLIVLMHLLIFLLFPTEYPRECYQSNNIFMVIFRSVDTHANCFPSLHVAVPLVFGVCYQYGVRYKTKISVVIFWCWSVAIIVSTITTKQHYIWDVVAACVLDILIIFLFRKKLK